MAPSVDKWILVQLTNGDTREVVSASSLVNHMSEVNIGSEVVLVRRGGDMETAKILCSSRYRDVLLEQISPVKINQQVPTASGSKPRADDAEDPYASSGSSWAPDKADASDSESELEIDEEHNNNLMHHENSSATKKKVMKPCMRADAINNILQQRKRKLNSSATPSPKPAHRRISVQRPSTSAGNGMGNGMGGIREPEPRASSSRASISRPSVPRASTSRASNYRENASRNSTTSVSRGTNTTQTSIRAIKRRKLEIGIKDIVRLNYTCSELFGLLKKFKYVYTGIDDYYDDGVEYPCIVNEDSLTEVKDEVEVTTTEIINYDEEDCMSDYSNRSEDNVLISNRYNHVTQQNGVLKEKNRVVTQPRRATRASVREEDKPSGSGIRKIESQKTGKPKTPRSETKPLKKPVETVGQNKDNTADEWVPIGSGMTFVHRDQYRKINFKSYTSATRGLLCAVFSRKTLATHSLTGKPSPAFMNKPAKMCLDPKKVSDIMYEVSNKCNVKESFVRTIITTKCADECKMYRMRMEKRKKQRRSMPVKENEPPYDEDANMTEGNNQANQTCPI